MVSNYATWDDGIIKLTWKQDYMPPVDLITSVHGICFYNEKVLLVDLNHRGWDIPGGHMEEGETPEQCFKREAFEEGYVEGNCMLLGAVEVDHHENPNWDESSKYPFVGYQLFYRMDVRAVLPFEAQFEADRRIFVETENIKQYINLDDVRQAMLYYAMQLEIKS
ncbi:NUDIX hydrolase [Paucisalibacillus sp. EB02]|uniref:NUDIX hydrolase n=1 Tax=Paucisalibacillus sp. EB02 TaxID=1347087 RepID=UPI0005AAA3AF|nr:NUDIX domain-containing protein [Paucisalibacillus sp. EB02]